ncbi:3-oxoacyl-ACP reductase FabG [Carboxylicivirga taeanensis]|uniref:3-oxoacyl-ACP reductase FabG n=1 Tax=Carboxylicivirga taeanensis TaxID=1416875 RepID=UPI003F6E047A
MERFTNRVVIITGGADGLGKAGALKMADEGASVVIWDLNEEKGRETLAELKGIGSDAMFRKVNTANYDEVVAASREVIEKYGKVDVLINNAGITRDATLKKMTPDQWQQVIDVNLSGVFNCSQVISQHMVAEGYGRIINTSSVVGLYGNFGQTNYAATKSGVIGMTKTMGKELARKGVTVNAVAPGFIATEMVKKMPQNVIDMMEAKIPVGKLGKPDHIASAYAYLASEEAEYINGTVLSVDGGIVI